MKELTIEQKAKRYDEAIKVAKSNYETIVQMDNNCTFAKEGIVNTFHHMFPELKESGEENADEKVRKALIKLVTNHASMDLFIEYDIHLDEALSWLEKQGRLMKVLQISNARIGELVEENYYLKEQLEKQGKPQVRTGIEWVNTIDDACDKRYLEEYAHGEYCHEQSFKWGFQEGVDWLEKQGEQKPTNNQFTPEQANILDKHIDKFLEQKQDTNIQINPSEYINDMGGNGCYLKNATQASTWNEEDNKKIRNIVHALKACENEWNDDYSEEIDWITSIRHQNNITDEELAQAKKDAYNDALDKIEYHSGEPTFDDGWSAAIWYLKKRNA